MGDLNLSEKKKILQDLSTNNNFAEQLTWKVDKEQQTIWSIPLRN